MNQFRTIQTKQSTGWVYILSNKKQGTLYIGVTNDLLRRVEEHQAGIASGFASKYNCHQLVYYEWYNLITAAIAREKQLKNWKRAWKIDLIEQYNPSWRDLVGDLKNGVLLEWEG